MKRPPLNEVLCQLRAIRGATFDDVANAMSSRCGEPLLNQFIGNIHPMSAEEIRLLEERGECDTPQETLYLLANVLGISLGHVPWFVDLVHPDLQVLDDPLLRDLDVHAEALAIGQNYATVRMGGPDELPLTPEMAVKLYEKSGLVEDLGVSRLLLQRFLREPYSPVRYRIFVVAMKDGDLFPFFSPGSLVLMDTQETLPPRPQPEPSDPFYLCSVKKGHRCGWPVMKENEPVLQTIRKDSSWHDLRGSTPLGIAVQAYWSHDPLNRNDFLMEDHRDRLTMRYIRALRREYPPKTVH